MQASFDHSDASAGVSSSCSQEAEVAFPYHVSDAADVLRRQHLRHTALLAPPPSTELSIGYPLFSIATDPRQANKAREIRLCSTARPHMRAFHFAWLSFFVAFFGWFSIPPLLPTIKRELQLSGDQVANSNIVAVASTIVGRVITGPLCDRYGPRLVQAALLVAGAIPVAGAALVTNYAGFMAVRFFIGLIGCSFVATTYWTSVMFCSEIVGRANALAAGWGNLGAGVTYLLTPLLFDVVTFDGAVSDNIGWRLTLVLPALFMVAIGMSLFWYSDDCPRGNYADLNDVCDCESRSVATEVWKSIKIALSSSTTWILSYQYACSFGVEIMVHNVLSLYYYEDFTKADCDPSRDPSQCRQLTQTTAGLISSLFGLMCIFARAAGGYASDIASLSYGLNGRTWVQFGALACQAVLLLLYGRATDLSWSIGYLVAFGFFVQACTGTTFAIVPYVLPPRFTGAVSGVVGAGGNLGAMVWGFLFKAVGNRADSFRQLSVFVGVASLLTLLIDFGDDSDVVDWTLSAVGIDVSTPRNGEDDSQLSQSQSSIAYDQRESSCSSREAHGVSAFAVDQSELRWQTRSSFRKPWSSIAATTL